MTAYNKGWLTVFMTDVVNPKSSSPDQLLPYHKKISVEDKALMVYFISYTYMVLNGAIAP